uniref:RNase H type-1 domain-containing protein n=1 Tax=Hyaloperonospora arabidopsidis (strain Emoy2) TaxID=559515 RepID=M4BJD5_HYAAE
MSGCLDWTSRRFRSSPGMLSSNLWTQALIYESSGCGLPGSSRAVAFCRINDTSGHLASPPPHGRLVVITGSAHSKRQDYLSPVSSKVSWINLPARHGRWRATVCADPGGAGSVIARLYISTHAACVLWVSYVAYGSTDTTNNVAEYWGLVHGFRQVQASDYSPLHVTGDSALAFPQLRMCYPSRRHTWRVSFGRYGT